MAYGSREIADKLYRYAALVEVEAAKIKAFDFLTDKGGEWIAWEREANEAQQMANYLWELKEQIGTP